MSSQEFLTAEMGSIYIYIYVCNYVDNIPSIVNINLTWFYMKKKGLNAMLATQSGGLLK